MTHTIIWYKLGKKFSDGDEVKHKQMNLRKKCELTET